MKQTTICNNCGCDYTPKRRGVQKFCSNSCRSRSWLLKQNRPSILKNINEQGEIKIPTNLSVQKKETMSLASVGNAALGVAVIDSVKSLFTPEDNKSATKKDIKELKSFINGQRYLEIKNIQNDNYSRKPYYDIETKNVVFLNYSL